VQALKTRKQFGNSGFWGGHIRPFYRFAAVDLGQENLSGISLDGMGNPAPAH
jgi:hypothetical protein